MNGLKRTPEQLQQRRQLCDDLYDLILQDKNIAEELIDEYVYLINDDRVKELQELCVEELPSDCIEEFIPTLHD